MVSYSILHSLGQRYCSARAGGSVVPAPPAYGYLTVLRNCAIWPSQLKDLRVASAAQARVLFAALGLPVVVLCQTTSSEVGKKNA